MGNVPFTASEDAAEDAFKLSQSDPITTALSLAPFHFSSLSGHTEKGNCMGKSISPHACDEEHKRHRTLQLFRAQLSLSHLSSKVAVVLFPPSAL